MVQSLFDFIVRFCLLIYQLLIQMYLLQYLGIYTQQRWLISQQTNIYRLTTIEGYHSAIIGIAAFILTFPSVCHVLQTVQIADSAVEVEISNDMYSTDVIINIIPNFREKIS